MVKIGQDVGWFGAHAEVGMSFGEGDGVVLIDDEDAGKRQTPTSLGGIVIAEAGVVEGDIDEDGLVVAAVVGWYGVGQAELGGYGGAGVGEQREGEGVLLKSEVVLARSLRRDSYEEGSSAADLGL